MIGGQSCQFGKMRNNTHNTYSQLAYDASALIPGNLNYSELIPTNLSYYFKNLAITYMLFAPWPTQHITIKILKKRRQLRMQSCIQLAGVRRLLLGNPGNHSS